MYQSQIVEIAGVLAGAAIRFPAHYRFVAVDPRLEEIDLSVEDIRRVAGSLIRTGRLPAARLAA